MPALTTLPAPRRIRSFVRREGRLTAGQQRALDQLWPKYGLDLQPTAYDFTAIFGRTAPLVLEIGYGMGDSLLEMAATDKQRDYLGIEVHRPGVGHLLRGIEERGITNLRTFADDAVEVVRQAIADNSLEAVHLFFPDPWPKKRHHKRRLVQPPFVELVGNKLMHQGVFHLATDWEPYAAQMREVLHNSRYFVAAEENHGSNRPKTKFEQRGERLGHGVWDLIYRRAERPASD